MEAAESTAMYYSVEGGGKKSKKFCGNFDNDFFLNRLLRTIFFGKIQCLGLSGPPNTAKSMVLGKKAPSGLSPHPSPQNYLGFIIFEPPFGGSRV